MQDTDRMEAVKNDRYIHVPTKDETAAKIRSDLEPKISAGYRESLVVLVEEAERIYGPENN
ncbi:MAG: hypothetical protein HY226_02920 [Candidatus Vogelbacteria bacterium]|nr:hypothetical protein [Candidatus Vogelbacteria bacterium]